MRGTGKWLIKPKEQMLLMLPAIVAGGLSIFIGYAFMAAIRYDAFQVFQAAAVDDRVVTQFLQEVGLFFLLFWGMSLVILLLCLLWSLWSSARVFGPISRLEKSLQASLNGQSAGISFQTRDNDLLRPFLTLLDQYLRKAKR